MEGYVYPVMGISFLVDCFLLTGTGRLTQTAGSIPRCVLSACLGAMYSGLCLLPEFQYLGNLWGRAASMILMAGIAFGWGRSAVRQAGLYVVLRMALGGIALEFGRGRGLPLLLSGVLLWLLCRIGIGGRAEGDPYVPVTIGYNGKRISVLALRDTGNTLRDPVTGKPVLVISAAVAQKLTGLTARQLKTPMETLLEKPVPGLRLIPYRGVGSSGMLLGMAFPDVTVGKTKCDAVIAFAPEAFGDSYTFQALTGGAV